MKKQMSRTRKLRAAFGGMPPLVHDPRKDIAFDWNNSEVAQWLLSRPETAEFIFDLARGARAIVYEKRRGAWIGRRHAILPRKVKGGF
jgi:hypothetical protein